MKIPYFNYAAILLLLSLVFITVIKNRRVKSNSNVLYIVNLVINICSALSSSIYLYFDNLGPGNLTAKYIFHTSYLLFHTWCITAYFFYIISLTDDWQHFLRLHITNILICIPILLTTAFILINLFTPTVFYFNQQDAYTRIWPLFGSLYVITAFYSIFSIVYVILHRNLYTRNQLFTILMLFPLLGISVVLELMTSKLVIESLFDAIGLLFVCTNIQRSEESINAETRFFNSYTFSWDMKKIFTNEKNVFQILINITNNKSVKNVIGHKNRVAFLDYISNHIEDIEIKHKIKAKNYYNHNGSFVITGNLKDKEKLLEIAQEINDFFKEPHYQGNAKVNLIANVCIIEIPENIKDYDTYFVFAQELANPKYYTGQLLYAKDLYNVDYYSKLRDIDHILINAINNNKFKVHYQPIYSIKEKKFTSAEALLRLFDDVYGNISPDFFITAAEHSGLIFKITDYVFNEVCRFMASKEFAELGIDYIEVNLSASECMQDNLAERFLTILNNYDISPSKINIEITETALTLSEEKLYDNIRDLVKAGFNISLDDFGSGYSNLQRITMLPLDIVKFDRSFIINIKDEQTRTIMISNIGKMIHEMGIKFLIEGVETVDVLHYFEQMDCDYVQGYYFSKPVSEQDFITFIKKSLPSQD